MLSPHTPPPSSIDGPKNGIGQYALIGNGHSAALISRSGSVDWCCWPRFDSPAALCRILDAERGGFFEIRPTEPFSVARSYEPDTNVLGTVFATDSGVVRVVDFMPHPLRDHEGDPKRQILRQVIALEGRVAMKMTFRPTFDFARAPTQLELTPQGAIARSDREALTLACHPETSRENDTIVADFEAASGKMAHWFALTHSDHGQARSHAQFSVSEVTAELEQTRRYWQNFASRCRYEGPYATLVKRSALALQLLFFTPTGGLVAAPTTSLPAEWGGERNWDYRYVWLRDAGLVLDGLQSLGYHRESKRFIDWFEQSIRDDSEVSLMYTVSGGEVPRERRLEHLAGFRASTPVRVGNGAREQRQVGSIGHMLDAFILCYQRTDRPMTPERWSMIRRLTNQTAQLWKEPGNGPWEIRGEKRHYLYSKLYDWVGLDRVIRFAEQRGYPGELDAWRRERSALRSAIVDLGYNPQVGAFTQAFGSKTLDATALTIPLSGFLKVDDPRVESTLKRIRAQLEQNGLLYRYQSQDGLSGSDKTFTLCSFWLVMHLAAQKKMSEAHELFRHVCSHANDVGLLSEQIDPESGELLGNFPQGFTHLGLIRAALWLDR